MTTARRFPKVSDAVDPQLESALRGKLRNFWNEPERGTDPIADASIVAEKVSKSSCFGAVVGVLAIIGALVAVFGSRNEQERRIAELEAELNFFRNAFPTAARNWQKAKQAEQECSHPESFDLEYGYRMCLVCKEALLPSAGVLS